MNTDMIAGFVLGCGVTCYVIYLGLTWAVNGLRASDEKREG